MLLNFIPWYSIATGFVGSLRTNGLGMRLSSAALGRLAAGWEI
jgi:hypothetical protein